MKAPWYAVTWGALCRLLVLSVCIALLMGCTTTLSDDDDDDDDDDDGGTGTTTAGDGGDGQAGGDGQSTTDGGDGQSDGDDGGGETDGDDGWETFDEGIVQPFNDTVDPACQPEDGPTHIASFDFDLPSDVTAIRIVVIGSNPNSRPNVYVGKTDGTNEAKACGADQDSSVTKIELTPTEFGEWYISISESAKVSQEYLVRVEIKR